MDLTSYLGQRVAVVMDRPLGRGRPDQGFAYRVNCGYMPGTEVPYGEAIDACYLGVDGPLARAEGEVIAVVRRLRDDDDKLKAVPPGLQLSDGSIEEDVAFEEQWFEHRILRK
jgi:inorganic pyrophosphatase